jgi:hypothetical protein
MGRGRTSERFNSASPTVKFKSSYTPPLIKAMTSTASNTFSTVPAIVSHTCSEPIELFLPDLSRMGTLDMLFLTSM